MSRAWISVVAWLTGRNDESSPAINPERLFSDPVEPKDRGFSLSVSVVYSLTWRELAALGRTLAVPGAMITTAWSAVGRTSEPSPPAEPSEVIVAAVG